MDKFGRNYVLYVQASDGETLQIGLPFTIEFDITRKTLASKNICQIRVYNLSKLNRNRIRKDVSNFSLNRAVELRAGYGQNLPVVFSGNISAAWSVREGNNFITQIECYDGGFAFVNGQTNTQFPSGTPRLSIIQALASSLPHVTVGAISPTWAADITARGGSYVGNTIQLLNEMTGGQFFIDKGKANVLALTEYIASVGGVLTINAATGLLGTPVLEHNIAHFDMIFEPALDAGCAALVTSSGAQNFDGLYKITAVKHRGMISDAVCGSVVTTGEFFFDKLLTPVISQ